MQMLLQAGKILILFKLTFWKTWAFELLFFCLTLLAIIE